jgi:phosphoenolpyruvate synthase/pyruvate phosphate dikinase
MPSPASTSRDQALVRRVGEGSRLVAGVAGGKGASLDQLMRLGWRVPLAICITADAFRQQLAAAIDADRRRALLAALPAADARTAIVEAFEAAPTVPDLRAALERGVASLDADHGSSTDASPTTFAVRSSALDEDGAVASFAGLHETELGRTAAEIEPAVRRCWASLWSIPAIAYRARRGLVLDDLAMAVVVQVLVAAEASAVIFTRDPVTGRADRILLTAIRGLGEPMVSGEATPDTIVVDRASRSIVERSAGRPGMRQFVEHGRIVERADPSSGPALSDAAIGELVELALAVEAAAGRPVDVEAAWARSTWFLLQSRPVTTI